ncbi:NUDIX domain-containing protein [Leeia aquatica]|uniref:GDP-mannose pyrophosphatase n=1 Tax=Leeia aquatica TaxID=2725557 RepID=A0A847S7U6_9NEIS|nr:NUDIX domain-containing protein [Leeia aquatica]NLR74935.1 NUDIX domain-containing protein [Leeia aquatica]
MAEETQRVRVKTVTLLSDNWYVLKTTTFDFLRRDGRWQTLSRETYDRGHGAVILLYHPQTQEVVLVRQFRYPAYVTGHDGFLLEAPAGLLDAADPEHRIREEVEEETGYQVGNVQKVFEAFMSPGSVTERLHFFVAPFDPGQRSGQGGGLEAEGEDIEVVLMPFVEAMQKVEHGEICDAKTIMLLQYAALHLFTKAA